MSEKAEEIITSTQVARPQPTLTADQIELARRQLAAAEQAATQQFGESLAAFLQQHGYQIVAWPTLTQDGRVVAQWGFKRVP